jgi:hypothetical protein
VIHVLVGCWRVACLFRISRGVCIYGTLAGHQRLLKKKKKNVEKVGRTYPLIIYLFIVQQTRKPLCLTASTSERKAISPPCKADSQAISLAFSVFTKKPRAWNSSGPKPKVVNHEWKVTRLRLYIYVSILACLWH